MKKRFLSAFLAFILLAGLAAQGRAHAASALSPQQVYQSMIALKEQYPEGTPWTNSNFYSWHGGIYSGGYGCAGFAFMLSDAAFGTLPARKLTQFTFSDVQVGDILRVNNDTHSVIVLEVKDSSVVIAEGNYNYSVHWGRTLSSAQVQSANYLITRYPDGSQTPEPTPAPTPEPTPEPTPAPAPAFTVTVSGPGGEIPKETMVFTLRNFTEEFVPNNRLSAIHTDFTRNEGTELVGAEDITTLALGTEVTVDGLKTKEGTGDVWDVVSLYAWSDPDGDGVYDQRLFTGFWERYSWTENNFTVVSLSNPGPFTYHEIDYGEKPIYSLSLNACGRNSLTSLWRDVENMAFPSSVTLSAEYLTSLFGPDTLIRFEVSTYGMDQFSSPQVSGTSSFYGYIPEGQTAPLPAFTDVPSWFEKEVAWAAAKKITNGYGGSTTFAPNVECPHIQILTFLWRAADKPASSAKCPVTIAASYYQEAANWAYEKGLIGDSFDPDAPCTRADAVSYIWQALDSPKAKEAASFSDVDAGAPYAGAVSWAVEKGVTKGYGGSDIFAPDLVCTRGEIAAFLYRAFDN